MTTSPTASLTGLTLHVADLERSIAFYAQIPGAVLIVHRPGQFALFRIGSGQLGLLPRGGGFHVEIETDDLDAMYEHLVNAGVKTEGPPTDRSWGERDLQVLDPDGHLLEFGVAHEDLNP